MSSEINRRSFFKTSAILAGGTAMAGCHTAFTDKNPVFDKYPYIKPGLAASGPRGLLFSMIGYEHDRPVKVILRLPEKTSTGKDMICRLTPDSQSTTLESVCQYGGFQWGSHWWTAEFPPPFYEDTWQVEIMAGGDCIMRDHGLRTGKKILMKETLLLASADMLERRVHFTKVGAGWQDAGTLWVESCSQSAMVIALTEILEISGNRIDPVLAGRICQQITVGCDYLVMLQKKALDLGFPAGAMSHDLHGHEKDILPNDAMKAVIALARSARLLPEEFRDKKQIYKDSALLTSDWLQEKAKPMGNYGLSLFQRGLPEGTAIPAEWQTRDLVGLCWAFLELSQLDVAGATEQAFTYAENILHRQIPQENNEKGFYGHFREFESLPHSEKSWIHGIVNNQFGADIGGIYPNYLIPVITLMRLHPEHPMVPAWNKALENFTYGYLVPACKANPFLLVPQGIFSEEGPVWFCGTFHGTNTVYGYTAALALELFTIFKDPQLRDIAYANLQWLAGLNAGITRETLGACVIFSTDVPENIALPVSMMCGVGKRWAGTWFQTRGVICNGFSTGKQFVYDTEPRKVNDGPFSLTDEDWIPHSAAWLTGLIRLNAGE